jgi:hypothetical protein
MKLFAFIMAVLVLAQSVMPCGDNESIINKVKSKTELTKANNKQSDQRDDCSPFCSCSCCAGVAFLAPSMKASFLNPQMVPVYCGTISTHLFRIALPIWQPPQLV